MMLPGITGCTYRRACATRRFGDCLELPLPHRPEPPKKLLELFGFLSRLTQPFLSSPEKGAETSIYLASSPEVEGMSGKYFAKKAEARSSEKSYDEAAARRLWQISADLTKLPFRR